MKQFLKLLVSLVYNDKDIVWTSYKYDELFENE